MLLDVRLPLFNFLFACISRYSCNVTFVVVSDAAKEYACISRYSCNVTFCFAFCFTSLLPALAGIRVMLLKICCAAGAT